MRRITKAIAQPISHLLNHVVRGGDERDSQNTEIAELVQSVSDYGRMRRSVYPQRPVVVGVDELAFRLRENRESIRRALCLLESQERARRTEHEGLWKLLM